MTNLEITFSIDIGWFTGLENFCGGAEREMFSLATEMAKLGHNVTFYVPCPDDWVERDVQLRPLRKFSSSLVTDILVTTGYECYVKKRMILYTFCDFGKIREMRPLCDHLDFIITDTTLGVQHYEAQGFRAIAWSPIIDISQGCNQRDKQKILFVGSLDTGKRPDLAIHAMEYLPDFYLKVIGSPRSSGGRGFPSYCHSIAGERVFFTGALPYSRVMAEMRSAQFVILPYCSENEFNPNVGIEALSNGCIIVAAANLLDYVEPDRDSLILENEKTLCPKSIADVIAGLPDSKINQLRQYGRETAQKLRKQSKRVLGELLS